MAPYVDHRNPFETMGMEAMSWKSVSLTMMDVIETGLTVGDQPTTVVPPHAHPQRRAYKNNSTSVSSVHHPRNDVSLLAADNDGFHRQRST